ncbi:HAD family hydrolase [Flavihumibacter sp. R14]|nr:HAD family hydrolase [Flavihumibacter soli]
MKKAIFVDKDGTLIPDIPYNADPKLINLNEGVVAGLISLQHEGFSLIVITNQSGVALGYITEDQVEIIGKELSRLLSDNGIHLSGFLYCPHHPKGTITKYATECICRKPKPGLIQQAAARWQIDLNQSWMIGDILNDVEAGNRAGCRTILINNGGETLWQAGEYRTPAFIARNINDAANYILEHNNESGLGGL